MAITSCPECNGKVSTKAEACPHCGVSLSLEEGPTCPECDAPVAAGTSPCPGCGCPIEWDADEVDEDADEDEGEDAPEAAGADDDASEEADADQEAVDFANAVADKHEQHSLLGCSAYLGLGIVGLGLPLLVSGWASDLGCWTVVGGMLGVAFVLYLVVRSALGEAGREVGAAIGLVENPEDEAARAAFQTGADFGLKLVGADQWIRAALELFVDLDRPAHIRRLRHLYHRIKSAPGGLAVWLFVSLCAGALVTVGFWRMSHPNTPY